MNHFNIILDPVMLGTVDAALEALSRDIQVTRAAIAQQIKMQQEANKPAPEVSSSESV